MNGWQEHRQQGNGRSRTATTLATAMLIAAATVLLADPAYAAGPSFTTTGSSPDVGALPVDPLISELPKLTFPTAPQQPTGCTFPSVTGPNGIILKHVAACAGDTGDGSPTNPWKTIRQAMQGLTPNQAAYVHGSGGISWTAKPDYSESDLRPASNGTDANARIWLMAAPGESPKVASPRDGESVFRLTKRWWVIDGLAIDGNGVSDKNDVVRVGDGLSTTPAEYIVLRHLRTRNRTVDTAVVSKAVVAFDRARNSALLDSVNPQDPNYGLGEDLAANGRPAKAPANDSDHHGITVKNGSNRILVRNNNSYGHNGDSFQCGEEDTAPEDGAWTSNVTVEGNRFHQDEENAVDLKACRGVTVRGNKFFGYRPARPFETERSGQGDAIVAHRAKSGRTADRILLELNRFWDNSRSINVDGVVPTAAVRRNLVFNSSHADCGMGAGMSIRAQRSEVYHNTLDSMSPQGTLPPGATAQDGIKCVGPQPSYNYDRPTADEAALQIAPGLTDLTTLPAHTVLSAAVWNNIISNAPNAYNASDPSTQSGSGIDTQQNLFSRAPATRPPHSLVEDPLYINDPATNDYYTQRGSVARDNAAPVPTTVADPAKPEYCDDPSTNEPDSVVEPDIGFLESCR